MRATQSSATLLGTGRAPRPVHSVRLASRKPPRRNRLFHCRTICIFIFDKLPIGRAPPRVANTPSVMPARQSFQDLNCNRRQWDFMRGVPLHALRRDRPKRFIEIISAQRISATSRKSLAGYEKHPNERRRRIAEALRCVATRARISRGTIQHALARLFLTDDLACLNARAWRDSNR